MPDNWSGRRGSNPRPTAWKAVTLPLSYSRLRPCGLRRGRPAYTPYPLVSLTVSGPVPDHAVYRTSPRQAPAVACLAEAPRSGAKTGGQGRIRTSVGTRPADLQSAAIDRSATYPILISARQHSWPSAIARFNVCPGFPPGCFAILFEAGVAAGGAGGGI